MPKTLPSNCWTERTGPDRSQACDYRIAVRNVNLTLTERQKEIATGLFALVTVGLGFGTGELGLRVLNLVRFGNMTGEVTLDAKAERFYIDEKSELRRQKPGRYGNIVINSYGFRGPEIVMPKPAGTIRIAYLGASFVYDPYVKSGMTWPLLTAQNLDRKITGCRVDLVNGGAPGYATAHSRTLFEHYIAPLKPDAAVVYTWDLTRDANRLVRESPETEAVRYRPGWFARHSLLWGKIEKNIFSLKLRRTINDPEGKLRFDPESLTRTFKGILTDLVASLHERGVKVFLLGVTGWLAEGQPRAEQEEAIASTVLYMPYFSVDGYLKAQDAYNAAIREVAVATGATFIDTVKVPPHSSDYFADSVHFNERGSKLFAAYLSDKLSETLSSESCR